MTAKLIVLSGLPGTGKTEVAEALAARLRAPVFAKDWLEASLLRSGAVVREQLSPMGYTLLTTLARRQLALGQSAVLDSVASIASIRATWRGLAQEFQASWSVIECICSDSEIHRQRLRRRQRGIPGWPELEWSEVERVQSYFEPWTEERLILDSVVPIPENVARAVAYVSARSVGRRREGPISDREFEGGCLCASTRFRVSGTATSRCYCHCNSCRLAFGAPFVAWVTFPAAEFRLVRGELAQYRSSEGVLRGFCASCGTGLTYRNQGRSEQIDVAVATLDEAGSLQPEYHIWVSHKPSWVTTGDGLPQFAEWRTSSVESQV